VDYKPDQYQESIVIQADNGHKVRNKRQATARTSFDNKQQESLTEKRVVSHHRQQRRLKPIRIHPYSPPTKKSPNAPLSDPPKQSTVNLTVPTSLIHPIKTLPVTKNQKNANTKQCNQSVSVISWIQITDPMKISDQFEMAATHILDSIHYPKQHSSH
jgi:hypothetical protein